MNYRKVYMKIILNAKKEMNDGKRPLTRYFCKNFADKYFEFHHILPRSLFPLWVKRKDNIVALTAREHLFCHQLLTKIYGSTMITALWLLSHTTKSKNHQRVKLSSKDYERLKIEYHKATSIPNIDRYGIEKANAIRNKRSESLKKAWKENPEQFGLFGIIVWNKGLDYKEIYTEEERKKFAPKSGNKGINNPFYGKKHSKESLEKMSKNRSGIDSWNKNKVCPQLAGSNNGRAKKVILLNTNEVFETITAAKKKYPMARHISECCSGAIKSAGKLNGEKLRWAYYGD